MYQKEKKHIKWLHSFTYIDLHQAPGSIRIQKTWKEKLFHKGNEYICINIWPWSFGKVLLSQVLQKNNPKVNILSLKKFLKICCKYPKTYQLKCTLQLKKAYLLCFKKQINQNKKWINTLNVFEYSEYNKSVRIPCLSRFLNKM